ncbi:MAG TPA: outer membrane beta-barrel protein, partial [Flavitalea sp.]|nr:outer membrane beta-barrel protein [Flavitalea sp.]
LTLPFRVTNWWNMQNNLSAGWYENTSFYKVTVKQDYGNFYGNSTQTFVLSKMLSLELSGWYNSGYGWGLYRSGGFGSLDIGAQKKFEKIKSTLSFNTRNLLNTLKSRMYINMPEQNLIINTSSTFGYTNFSITYNHRFGKDSVKQKRERNTGAEDEKNRAY